MLEVKNICKTYPGENYGALNNVSFNVSKNKALALIGKSGSGKSTMLQIIAGLIKPDSGTVTFNGSVLENPEEQLIAGHEKIKMVFQDFKLEPNMTVEENVRYKLLHFNKAYQKERTKELLALCGLSTFEDKKPAKLSGGQRQRLSIARALADDPELLLMDEPFSNLDPLTRESLLLELGDIVSSESLGLIFVTHDTQDAMLIAHEMVFLSEGGLIQNTSPQEMYENPKNLEVASFFGRVNNVSHFTGIPRTYVRAENLVLSGSHDYMVEAQLKKSVFMGDRYLIELKDPVRGETYYLYSFRAPEQSHDSIRIGFSESSMMRLD